MNIVMSRDLHTINEFKRQRRNGHFQLSLLSSHAQPHVPASHKSYRRDHIQRFDTLDGRLVSEMRQEAQARGHVFRQSLTHPSPRTIPLGYVPVRIDDVTQNDPTVTLCPVPFDIYATNPFDTPLFDELVLKHCTDDVVLTERLSVVAALPIVVEPTGFVFSTPRSGSTLVAHMLASEKHNMVCEHCRCRHVI